MVHKSTQPTVYQPPPSSADVLYEWSLRNKNNTSTLKHQLLQTLGFPLFSLCHVLQRVGIGGPLRLCPDFDLATPRNRLVSHAASYFFFLILLLLNILNPDDDPNKFDLNWYNYLMPLFTFGFLFIDLEKVQNSNTLIQYFSGIFQDLI